jgi:hypothetical protein
VASEEVAMTNNGLHRLARGALHTMLLLALVATSLPASAGNWGARREYREGMREMRREILSSGSRAEARREYREGMLEIARERREMRREVRRARCVMAAGTAIVTARAKSSRAWCWAW